MTLNFIRKATGLVYAVFYHEGQQKAVYVGKAKSWDKVKKVSGDSVLDAKMVEIRHRFNQYMSTGVPSVIDGKKIVKGDKVKGTFCRLTELFDIFLSEKANMIQGATAAKYTALRDQLIEFENHKGSWTNIDQVDRSFYLHFVDYLIKEHDNVNKTILRKIKSIKTVMKYGAEEGMVNHMRWNRRIELRDSKASRVPLNKAERQLLWSFTTTDLMERRIVDAFIFCMYSGLRYEDLAKLSHNHIFADSMDGNEVYYINMTATKTVDEETIPILDVVKPLIDKYTGNPLFNLPFNAQANETLKRVAKRIGLDRVVETVYTQGSSVVTENKKLCDIISFHFARYTYTQIMSQSGLHVNYIQRNLNHSKLETTNSYMRGDTYDRIIQTRTKVIGI